jgi:hypothetical protein
VNGFRLTKETPPFKLVADNKAKERTSLLGQAGIVAQGKPSNRDEFIMLAFPGFQPWIGKVSWKM